jgi:hypothetical protein
MQQPKVKRPDTPLATSPDPGIIGGAKELMDKKRYEKKAESKTKENQKKIIIKQAGDKIKSDASKYI